MMYGGKVKKMAVGGTTGKFVKDRSRKSGKRFVSNRSAMLKEIDKLEDSMKGASKSEKAKMQKLIDAKKAGIKSTSLTVMDQLGFPGKHITNRNYRSPIPTRTGTKMDEDSAEALKRRNVLKKESKREKKAGGKVKKMAQGGTAARQEQLNERGIFGDAKAYTALNPTQQKMKKQVDKLQSSLMMQDSTPSNPKHSAADVKRIRKEIKDKKAGLDAGFKSYAKDRLKFRKSTTGGKKAEKFIGKTPDPDKLKVGGKVKKKMAMGGMAMKYKHGGKVGKKCPRDGIAMKGKTRA